MPTNRHPTGNARNAVRTAALILAVVAQLVSPAGALLAVASAPRVEGAPSLSPTPDPDALPPEAVAKIDPALLDELLSLEGLTAPCPRSPASARPPDALATYLVYLEDEAPLSGLSLPRDRDARRRAVVERLRERAEHNQRGAIAALRECLASGLTARYRSYWIANVLVVEGGLEVALALALIPEILSIEPNRTIQLALPEGYLQPSLDD